MICVFGGTSLKSSTSVSFMFTLFLNRVICNTIGCSDKRTWDELMTNLTGDRYNPKLRPNSTGAPTKVELQVYLSSITTVDQKKMQVGVAGYFRLWWNDDRLAYLSRADGGCFDELILTPSDQSKVWQPDIYFDNVLLESYGAGLFNVYPTGRIWKSTRMMHIFECQMNFSKLPFDTQVCTIKIASYSEDSYKVLPEVKDGNKGLLRPSDYTGTAEWELSSLDSRSETLWFGEIGSQYPWKYVYLDLKLERLPDFYTRGVVITTILFVCISWAGLFVNRTLAPARVTVAVIPVLIIINLNNAVNASLPSISYSTWLTSFLTMSTWFTVIAVFEYGLAALLMQMEAWRGEKLKALHSLSGSALKLRSSESNDVPESELNRRAPRAEDKQKDKYLARAAVAPAPPDGEPPPLSMERFERRNSIFKRHRVVDDIFKKFDWNSSGKFSRAEMRKALRGFGQYFSLNEVDEIFEKLGVPSKQDMPLSTFEVFLDDPNKYMPPKGISVSFVDQPPSLQLDIVTRIFYPTAYAIATAIYMFIARS